MPSLQLKVALRISFENTLQLLHDEPATRFRSSASIVVVVLMVMMAVMSMTPMAINPNPVKIVGQVQSEPAMPMMVVIVVHHLVMLAFVAIVVLRVFGHSWRCQNCQSYCTGQADNCFHDFLNLCRCDEVAKCKPTAKSAARSEL
ncbi:MAG: hypothetical protein AB7S74_17305 [Hyphomicrobium sp.]